jgi:type II secretory pathway pseudopilin PulG
MLVVIALIGILAAMTVAFMPNAFNSEREARAATLLQGWLNIAKQRALRDQAPRGLRIWFTNTTIGTNALSNVVLQCQYIEQPDDFCSGQIHTASATQLSTIVFTPVQGGPVVDLLNGFPHTAADEPFWSVQNGDYLEVFGTGLMHTITVNSSTQVTIAPPLPFAITTATPYYRILRGPRATGNDMLTFPDQTVLDANTNATFNNPLPAPISANSGGGYADILFSPSGAVITRNLTTSTVNLWVRSPSDTAAKDSVFFGSPTIVAVHVQTGVVGAYPPGPQNNPYANIQ